MNLRKLLAAQLSVGVFCSNAYYVVNNISLWFPIIQAFLLCGFVYLFVQLNTRNHSISTGFALWVGSLSMASLLLSVSVQPNNSPFDAGIYDRGPLFVGLICAALWILLCKLLPWDLIEEDLYETQ